MIIYVAITRESLFTTISMYEGHVSVLQKCPENGRLFPLLVHLSGKITVLWETVHLIDSSSSSRWSYPFYTLGWKKNFTWQSRHQTVAGLGTGPPVMGSGDSGGCWGSGRCGEGHSSLPSRNTLYALFHDTPFSLIFLKCFFFSASKPGMLEFCRALSCCPLPIFLS